MTQKLTVRVKKKLPTSLTNPLIHLKFVGNALLFETQVNLMRQTESGSTVWSLCSSKEDSGDGTVSDKILFISAGAWAPRGWKDGRSWQTFILAGPIIKEKMSEVTIQKRRDKIKEKKKGCEKKKKKKKKKEKKQTMLKTFKQEE